MSEDCEIARIDTPTIAPTSLKNQITTTLVPSSMPNEMEYVKFVRIEVFNQ